VRSCATDLFTFQQGGNIAEPLDSKFACTARLFGSFSLTGAGGCEVTHLGKKTRALVAYLLLADGPVQRERLAELLWGDRAEEQARASLRQALYELRALSAGDHPLLVADRSHVALVQERIGTDLGEMRALAETDDAATIAELLGERPPDLLGDLNDVDPAFDEWLAGERVRRREERQAIALAMAQRACEAGMNNEALQVAQRLLAAEPCDEDALRMAMTIRARSGNHAAARQLYTRYVEAMRHDFDAPPSPAITALVEGLSWTSSPSSRETPAPGERLSSGAVRPARLRQGLARHKTALGVVATALVAGAFAIAGERWAADPPGDLVRVDALAGVGGESARLLALSLHENIVQVLSQSSIPLATARREGFFARPPRASEAVRGSVIQGDGRLKVDLFIDDDASGTTLWSEHFERASASSDKLSTEASIAAARTIYTIRELNVQHGARLDPKGIALYVRGEELLRSVQTLEEGGPREVSEQIVARAPKSAAGHALLAMALAGEARRATRENAAPLVARSRDEARKAIALDASAAGSAYDALYITSRIEHPQRIAEAEDWLLQGMNKAPAFAFLPMRECRLLTEVGRARDALAPCQRALALHPFAEPITHAYATALSEAGDDRQAQDAIEQGFNYNPEHTATRFLRFELAAFGGRPAEALALLADSQAGPQLRQRETAVLTRYLKKAGKWNQEDRREIAQEITRLALRGEMSLDLAVMALSSLGRLDEAFELLHSQVMDETLYGLGAGFLFQPASAAVRADPRFWTTAADFGLAQYWITRDRWPDMCREEFDMNFCKAQVARVLRRKVG
jgi:DNA-binding SARP family transcriptional activator